MHRWSRFIAVATLACGWAMAAEDQPKAEAILDKYIEASGGRATFQKFENQVTTGTMEFVGKGMKAKITAYKAKGGKSYTAVDMEGIGKIESGADGDVAWEKSPIQGPRVKRGEELASAMRDALLYPEWRDVYKKAEAAGTEMVEDHLCYKVTLTPATEGKPETRYFDKSTNLLVKATKIVKTPMGEIPAEIYLSDYKKIDGLLIPLKVRQKALSQELLITLETVKHNVDIPANRFALPEDIKALVEKNK